MVKVSLILNGRESALLVAAVGVLDSWGFASPAARELVAPFDRAAIAKLDEWMSKAWMAILQSEGLWWDQLRGPAYEGRVADYRALIQKRSELVTGLSVDPSDLVLSALALRATLEEFAEDTWYRWHDFCAVSGLVPPFDVTPAELRALLVRLESPD